MIKNSPPFKGLNIRIPIITPINWRGFINQGSTVRASKPSTLNPLKRGDSEC